MVLTDVETQSPIDPWWIILGRHRKYFLQLQNILKILSAIWTTAQSSTDTPEKQLSIIKVCFKELGTCGLISAELQTSIPQSSSKIFSLLHKT